MKRTATTLVLLAGFGGGCVSPEPQAQPQTQMPPQRAGGFGTVTRGKEVGGVQGPTGEPVMAVRGSTPMGGSSGVKQAGGPTALVGDTGIVRPVSGFGHTRVTANEGCTSCSVPGVGGGVIRDAGSSYGPPPGYGAAGPYGPQDSLRHGIVPVPTMGPPGAVAAFGAIGAGGGGMGMRAGLPNGRSSINFTGPAGMKVTWQLPDGSFNDEASALTAPKAYNFLQGSVYRLRLTSILPDHPGSSFYPTLEVAPANPKTLVFLSHSSVPITFTADDFAQAKAGNLVVKVVYLPDPINQDFSTVAGAEEVVSTRLEPGADPVAEAQRRGAILAIIRMGNIDLENRVSPAMTAPPPGLMLPPGGPAPVPAPNATPPKPKGAVELPINPPGTASVRPLVALPGLPAGAPTDLPLAPSAPVAPTAPGLKSAIK